MNYRATIKDLELELSCRGLNIKEKKALHAKRERA
jgi:hypothetical protein